MVDFKDNEFDEDSMPCPCQKCGSWFDMYDGQRSEKWFPQTIICADCAYLEGEEIANDEEIKNSVAVVEDALYTLKEQLPYLASIGAKLEIDWQKLEILNKPDV